MKQSEKLDVILRYLYDRKDDNKEYSIADVLAGSGIETNPTEIARLAEHLERDKYVKLNNLSSKLKKAKITSKGITYAEGDSYSHKGNNIINHYNVVNSPQTNIVVNSNQVSIDQTQYESATEIIKQIRDTITQDESVAVAVRTEILECLTEIESGIENKKTPKFAIKSLLGIGSDIASISGFILNLAQLFPGIVPGA
ncbi:MAG TPA: hypothetical protein VFD46_10715 [Chryseolinea sp.]|nr:hypothetical protein [Chryseolinea sp.]